MYYSVTLLDGRVVFTEAELVRWNFWSILASLCRRLRKSLSKILDMTCKRLIGLYDFTLVGGFAWLVNHYYLGEFPP